MKTYTYERDATTGTWKVIEHEVKFAGLSENEARETTENLKVQYARREALYRKIAEAGGRVDATLLAFG